MIHWTKKDAIEAITTLTNPFEKLNLGKEKEPILPDLSAKIKEVAERNKEVKTE